MKKLLFLLILIVGGSTYAQSIFSPIPDRVRGEVTKVSLDKVSLTTPTDSTSFLWSLTASVNGLAYEIGANSGGHLVNGTGIGASYAKFKLITGHAIPVWDVSASFLTSLNLSGQSFTGAGVMVAAGFNPGYLLGVGTNPLMIREGVGYMGTQGFTGMKVYLITSFGINF